MLHIAPITHKAIWEQFLKKYSGMYPLFQSWQWGEVQKVLGFSIERIGLFDGKKLVGVAQLVNIHARRGHYLHVRQGPVIDKKEKIYWKFFVDSILKKAKKEKASFVRISPLVEESSPYVPLPFGTISSPIHNMDAEICWVLPLAGTEQDILSGMRKSHRYLIKKAQQMPIKIIQTKSKKSLDSFLPLYEKLAKRRHFVAHHGIVEEMDIFSKDDMSELFVAEYEGKIICGALIDFVGNMAIYRHSASDEAYRAIPAMYLLQWEVIKEARKRGKELYNFWGIAPTDHKTHPWSGLTLFKTGFGGEKKEFMHAKDIILSPLYVKTYAIDRITKLIKGY